MIKNNNQVNGNSAASQITHNKCQDVKLLIKILNQNVISCVTDNKKQLYIGDTRYLWPGRGRLRSVADIS